MRHARATDEPLSGGLAGCKMHSLQLPSRGSAVSGYPGTYRDTESHMDISRDRLAYTDIEIDISWDILTYTEIEHVYTNIGNLISLHILRYTYLYWARTGKVYPGISRDIFYRKVYPGISLDILGYAFG